MKNTLVLFIILFNIFNSFSQTPEQMLDKMFEIANNKSDQEGAKNIALDLINSKYGAIDNETNFYAQYVISDFYYGKRKFKLALHYFNKLLQFSEDKNIKVEGIRQFLKDIKLKIQDSKIFLLEDNSTEEAVVAEIKKNTNHGKPSDHEKNQMVTINTNSKIDSNLANHKPSTSVNTPKTNDDKTETLTVIETEKTLEEVKTTDSNFANQTPSTSVNTPKTNDDKTVTLTVSGTGKTIEEAKTNALRSAIEQAFGAFISSKTEILNDNLIKDEIVSVANGNVQKYDIVSQVEVPNIGYAITLSATVSVTKLTSFIESKGGEIEFKGSLFSFNIKQQVLNEMNEKKAVLDLLTVSKELIDKSFDYSIKLGNPQAINGNNESWKIPIEVTVNTNENFLNMYNYLVKTLKSISLNESEVKDYNSLGKKVFIIEFQELEKIYLRTQASYEKIITEFTLYFCKSMLSVKIVDNAGQYSFSPDLKGLFGGKFLPIDFSYKEASKPNAAANIFNITKYLSAFIKDYNYQSLPVANNPGNGYGYTFGNRISLLKYSGGIEIAKIIFFKVFTLEQINQLSGFKVTK